MPTRTEEERQLIIGLLEKEPDVDCNARVIKYLTGGKAYAAHCSHESGWGTTHKGRGRCKLHGGASDGRPIVTGVYSKSLTTDVATEMERIWNDPNFGSLLEELAVTKAMFSNLMEDASGDIEGSEFWEVKDVTITATGTETVKKKLSPKAEAMFKMIDLIGKTVERIINAEAKMSELITARQIQNIITQIKNNSDTFCGVCPVKVNLKTGLNKVRIPKGEES